MTPVFHGALKLDLTATNKDTSCPGGNIKTQTPPTQKPPLRGEN